MKPCSRLFLVLILLLYPNLVRADVDTLRPNAAPTENWEETGCTDHEDCVSDDDDETFIWDENVATILDCFQCPDFTSEYSVIDSVVMQIRALEYNIFGDQEIAFGRGGKDGEGFHATCPDAPHAAKCACENCPQQVDSTGQLEHETWTNYRFAMFNCDPCDSSVWEAEDLNNTDRNWSALSMGQDIQLSEVYVLVYYQPPVEGNPRRRKIIIGERFDEEDFHLARLAEPCWAW